MIIQSLEQKTRLALLTVLIAVSGSVVFCCAVIFWSLNLVTKERNQIYVIDGEIPFLAERAQLETTFKTEAEAHINLFHQYFFNLPPDNTYIEYSLGKAMYMADGSALKQKRAMDENGFYSDLVSSSAVCSIMCDSIVLNEKTLEFVYYGKQTIKRRSAQIRRSLVTSGKLQNVPRSDNNPHGLMICGWRTLENKDLSH